MESEGKTEELLISQWEQPVPEGALTSSGGTTKLLLLAIPVALVLGVLAIWQKELNYALAGAVILVGLVAARMQNKSENLSIAITTHRIVLGKREYPLASFSGFWIARSNNLTEINLETKRTSLLPITLLSDTNDADAARAIFSQILPELEPRERTLGDRVGRYFRL